MLRGFRPIRIPMDGGRREDLPAGHPEFPGRDSPDMRNVVVWDGVCRKWPGVVPYTSVGLGAPVRFLARFELGSGNRYLVASDGLNLFKLNSQGTGWDKISFGVYKTGTCSVQPGSPHVTGSGTSWVTGMVGRKFRYWDTTASPAQWSSWHDITAVNEGNQELTLSPAPSKTVSNTNYEIETTDPALSSAGQCWLRATVARSGGEDLMIVTNGVDAPLKWNGTGPFGTLRPSTPPPKARFITTFHQQNLLVMARDASDPFLLLHSDAGDYGEWSADLAGEYHFEDSTAPITGLDGSHEYLYLFREDGIQRGFWEGTGVGISWSRISGIDGPVYPNSLVRLGGEARMGTEAPTSKWAYFGTGNVFAFDGETIMPIGDPVRPWLFDRIDPEYPDNVVGVVIPQWGLAVWSFPTIGSGGVCTDSVAYDYKHDRWFPRTKGWSAFAGYDLTKSDVEWDSLEGTVDGQTRIFDAINVAPQPICLVGDENGYVYYLAFGVNDNGQPIRARRSTAVFSCDERASYHEIGAVSFRTTVVDQGLFTVAVYGGDRPEELAQLQTATVNVADYDIGRVRSGEHRYIPAMCIAYLRCGARYVQVRIDNDDVSRDYSVYDLTVWVRNTEA